MKGDRPQKLKQIIKATEGLSIDDDGYINVESTYCRHVVSVVERFFDTIFEFTGFGPKDTVIAYR
jgi:hypothetical protein